MLPLHATPDLLRNVPLFNALEQTHLDFIAASSEIVKFERGNTVFLRGAPVHHLYYLLTGCVKIYAMSKDGAEKVIHLTAPGESFGEAAMFLDTPAPVGTETVQDSTVLVVPRSAIHKLMDDAPRIGRLMLAGMSMRMHRLIKDIEALALQSANERVIHYLLQLCNEQPERQNIILPARKATIASLLNLTPETLSRTMTKLEKEGLIRVKATEVEIPDPDELRTAVRV